MNTTTSQINDLILTLKQGDFDQQTQASDKLRKIGSPANDSLLNALDNADANMRWWIVMSLTLSDDPRLFDVLVSLLRDPDRRVRETAAGSLGMIGNPRAIRPLQELESLAKTSAEYGIHTAASGAITQIEWRQKSLDELSIDLQSERVESRRAAIVAMLDKSDKRAFDSLLNALSDQDGWVRIYTVMALEKLADNRAVPFLCHALQDSDDYVRSSAAHALGEIGDPRALLALEQVLTHPDPSHDINLHAVARGAIKKIQERV
jgi:HEAT repeat protein